MFFADNTVAVEREPHEIFRSESRDEETPVPRRKHFARVERDAGRRDIGRPEVNRLLHSRLRRFVTVDRFAGVVAAVADDGEPVVLALFDVVDLVSTART